MGNIAWSRRRELNPQPAAYKAAALPLSHFGIKNPPAQMPGKAYRSRRCGDGHTDFSERSGKEVVEMMTKRECGRLTDARLYCAYSVSERERRLKYRHRDGLCSTAAVAFFYRFLDGKPIDDQKSVLIVALVRRGKRRRQYAFMLMRYAEPRGTISKGFCREKEVAAPARHFYITIRLFVFQYFDWSL